MNRLFLDEDAALVAFVIDGLRGETKARGAKWIARHLLGPGPRERVAFAETVLPLRPSWRRVLGLFVRLDQWGERRRLRSLLPEAVTHGWLEASDEGYRVTRAGLAFAEEEFRQRGETQQDSAAAAADICRALERAGGPLTEASLRLEVFPIAAADGQHGPAFGLVRRAYSDVIPELLRDAIAEAVRRAWIARAGDRWRLTDAGRAEGVRYGDEWR